MIGPNNPGNLRYNAADRWQGAAEPPQIDGFCAFTTPVYGIRALARVLIAYQDKHGCHTIAEFIGRYAPESDSNPTAQYIKNVSEWTGFGETQPLNVHTYEHARPLVEAIIRQEQGTQIYSAGQINDALSLSGIIPNPPVSAVKAVAQDPKVIAATIAGAAGSAQAVVSSVSGLWDTLNQTFDPRYLIWACVAVIVSVGIYYAAEKIIARHEGRI